MTDYSTIAIIYNPNATGNGQQLGQKLIDKLTICLPGQKFELIATKRIGHAEELAYRLAKEHERPLVISASGDGGYHEVVNGLMRAQTEGATPTAGLLPAGNANDHYRNVHTGDIVQAICAGKVRRIDTLRLRGNVHGQPYTRFAHSYIGFGINAKVAERVRTIKGKQFREFLMVVRTVLPSRPVEFMVERRPARAHSLVVSNVNVVGKYFKMANNAQPDDGKFELTIFAMQNKLKLMGTIVKLMMRFHQEAPQLTDFSFISPQPMLMQLDGEILTLDAGREVQIDIKHHSLRCIV